MGLKNKGLNKYMQCILPAVPIIAAYIVIILLYPCDALKSKHKITACCVDEWAKYILVLIQYNSCNSEYDWKLHIHFSVFQHSCLYYETIIQSVYSTNIYWELRTCGKNTVLSAISSACTIKSEFLTVSLLPLRPALLCIAPPILPGQVLFEGFWRKRESIPLCLSPAV